MAIKDRVTILETLADSAVNTKDIELLTEYVRMALSKGICSELVDDSNYINVATLSGEVERLIAPKIRAPFKRLVEMVFPNITVLSLNEIPNEIQIKAHAIVNI